MQKRMAIEHWNGCDSEVRLWELGTKRKTLTCGTQQVTRSLWLYRDSKEGSYSMCSPEVPGTCRGLEIACLKDFNDGGGSSWALVCYLKMSDKTWTTEVFASWTEHEAVTGWSLLRMTLRHGQGHLCSKQHHCIVASVLSLALFCTVCFNRRRGQWNRDCFQGTNGGG